MILLGLCILMLCISPVSATRTRSGRGTLSAGDTRESTLNGHSRGLIEGIVNATEGHLEIYVLHSDDYVDLPSLNTLDCIVYEEEMFHEFSFDVTFEGDWVLILRNPNVYNVNYEFSWTSYEPGEISIVQFGPMIFPLFLFLIGLGYVITVQRGVIPDKESTVQDSLLPATIGLGFIGLSLILPVQLQITPTSTSGSPDNVLFALLWKLTIFGDGLAFQWANLASPYSWISPLLFIGPTFLFPFALIYYYQNRISKRRMVELGFVSVLPILSMTVIGLMGSLFSPLTRLYLVVPLPLVLILGLVAVKFKPIPEDLKEVQGFS